MNLLRLSVLLICLGTLAGCAVVSDKRKSPIGIIAGCECENSEFVGDRVFFDFNKFTLSKDANATLGRQAAWLAHYRQVKVQVAGNADARGTETYNLALGYRRAHAARDVLVARGIAPARIQTISYGKECPVAPGNDEASYQQNRVAITSVLGWNPQNCR